MNMNNNVNNITSRRKKNVNYDEQQGSSQSNNFRDEIRVAVKKNKGPETAKTFEPLRKTIEIYLNDRNGKSLKITPKNCFTIPSAVDFFATSDVKSVPLQEASLLLDSAHQIYGCRVERLHQECHAISNVIASGDYEKMKHLKDGNGSAEPEVTKSRRKKNLAEGVADIESVLAEIQNAVNNKAQTENENNFETNDAYNMDEIENADWDENCCIEKKVQELREHRLQLLEVNVFREASLHCVLNEKQIELEQTDIDWLKTNPYYQKAVAGSADDLTSSFHSLLYNGLYSEDGRLFKLHPRIKDDDKMDTNPYDINHIVVENLKELTINAMASSPIDIPNSLMLEVTDRPRIANIKSMKHTVNQERHAEYDSNVSVLPSQRPVSQMTTLDGDTSVLPPQARPASRAISMDTATDSESGLTIASKAQDHESIPFEDILMDDNLDEIFQTYSELRTNGLEALIDVKLGFMNEEDESKKVWMRGLNADEWNDETIDMARDMIPLVSSGIDTNIKYLDYMVNSDATRIIFTKESLDRLSREAQELDDIRSNPYSNLVVHPGKYYILKPSDSYLKMYPQDRRDHFIRIENDDEAIPINICEEDPIDNADDDFGNVVGFEDNDITANLNLEENPLVPEPLNVDEDNVADAFFNSGETGENNEAMEVTEGANEAVITESHEPVISIRPEVEAEIRNLGKIDNCHWKLANSNANNIAHLKNQRKRKEKKMRNKAGIEDFARYFEPSTDVDQVEKVTSVRCTPSSTSLQLKDSQIYMEEIPTESKPHVAFEFEALSRSGLMFKKKYGRIRFERDLSKKSKNNDILIEDIRGGEKPESDCIEWLLTFNGFKCAYKDEENEDLQNPSTEVDLFDGGMFDDDNEEPSQEALRMETLEKMGEIGRKKYLDLCQTANDLRTRLNRRNRCHDGSDESDDENYANTWYQKPKTVNAVRNKRGIAEILNSEMFSLPNLLTLLEKIQNDGGVVEAPSLEDQRDSLRTPVDNRPNDDMNRLDIVFKVKQTPEKDVDVAELMKELTEEPSFMEEGEEERREEQSSSDAFSLDAVPIIEKVRVAGTHTFMGLLMSLPLKLKEEPSPGNALSFALHLCNENSLNLIQDRTNKNWMTDFLFLNDGEEPEGVTIGNFEDESEDVLKLNFDPCAIVGSQNTISNKNNKTKKKIVPKNTSTIIEEDEDHEEISGSL